MTAIPGFQDAQRALNGRAQRTIGRDVAPRLERSGPVADEGEPPIDSPSAHPWPDPPDSAAFHGLAGEIVQAIEPHTEADRVALLVQLLTATGNAIGRGPGFTVEADRHGLNLFAVLVGASSKGRKGTSWGQVQRVLAGVDPEWTSHHVTHGLSSGEGLIWAVRDPIQKHTPVKEGGRVVSYQDVIEDPGVTDKRLLVLESEFAKVLRVMAREGSTLSATVRQAWDSGNLRVMTKTSPAVSTGAHISLIGHVTTDELRRYLSATEAGNGFANRFLFLCVRRARCLPEGGRLPDAEFALICHGFRRAVDRARLTHDMARTPAAQRLWAEVYPDLSDGFPGLLGSVTSRAEAQVLRLSLLYALLDSADAVDVPHLRAALALWEYALASARFVFGSSLGDPVADQVKAALEQAPNGLTRTAIRDLLGRHAGAPEIDRALATLAAVGQVNALKTPTEGRPLTTYQLATKATKATKGGLLSLSSLMSQSGSVPEVGAAS